jgi:plastocyanin
MRSLLYALVGFLAGGALIVAISFVPQHIGVATAAVSKPTQQAQMPMGGGSMMGSRTTPASRTLMIQHVRRGCHIWSNGTTRSPTMRMTVRAGATLRIRNQDLDAHRLMLMSGPTRLHMGGPMMMNHSVALSFPRKGVYSLRTKTVEMPGGMEIEAETIGPDNTLRLIVTVV